jgi:O-antigen/teichoic acid export membrane protein
MSRAEDTSRSEPLVAASDADLAPRAGPALRNASTDEPLTATSRGSARGGATARAAADVKRAVFNTASWIAGGFFLTYLIRLGSSLVLTRLVAPQVFGLMSLVNAFLIGLHMFSDVGIGASIIQHARGDDAVFQNTAWSVQVLRGLGLWCFAALLAWPLALFYHEPLLVWLIPAAGCAALIDGFNCTSMYTLGRRLARGRLVVLDIVVALVGTAITVGCVWAAYPDMVVEVLRGQRDRLPYDQSLVWALLVGNVLAGLVRTGLTHLLVPGFRNCWCWDRECLRELVSFGKWIFLSTICTFLAFQSDRLIVPKLVDFNTLGVYGIALNFVSVATNLMSMFAAQLVFPLYSRLRQGGRDLRAEFVSIHSRAAAFSAVLVTGLLSCGPAAIHVLYPHDFHAAGWMVVFLSVGAWFQMLEATAGAALLARGKAGAVTISNATKFVGLLIFVPVGYWLGARAPAGFALAGVPWHGGLSGMILGFVASDVARYFMVIVIARRNGMSALLYDVCFTLLIVVIGLASARWGNALASRWIGAAPLTRPEQALLLCCQGMLVVLLWSLVATCCWGRQIVRRVSLGRLLPSSS